MKHTVTLEQEDLNNAIKKYVENHFPNYGVTRIRVNHTNGHGPMEADHTSAEVELAAKK